MERLSKDERIGLISIVAALIAVVAWWTLLVPGISKYKTYRHKANLKAKLQSIRPPAGIQSGNVQVVDFPEAHYITAIRFDVGQRDCIASGTHYRNEFAKAGFGYNGEQIDSEKHTRSFSFAASDYHADVTCQEEQSGVFIYAVTMTPQRT
jgi:hypothetical protein